MLFDLRKKTAVVTGGSGGIGKDIVLSLAANGANVVLADIEDESSVSFCREMRKAGLEVTYVNSNIADSSSVEKLMKKAVELYGSLDIVVNSAGLLGDAEITDISDEEWRRMMSVNLDGVFYCCREAVRIMEIKGAGKIINIASAGGKQGFPFAGVHYCSSKGAVMALTRQLALQIGKKGITVNAVAPGTTQTTMIKNRTKETIDFITSHIPVGRMGLPKDTAAAVVFLASSSADFITGETIDVNGGLYMD